MGVSYAKTTIIVRSVVVSAGNLLSNVGQLIMNGVGPIDAMTGMRDKAVEISQYVANREEILRLNVELSSEKDTRRRNSLEGRIQALEDANARLSIQPLIKAGEFSTIAERHQLAGHRSHRSWGGAMENRVGYSIGPGMGLNATDCTAVR